MTYWQQQLHHSIIDPGELADRFGIDPAPLVEVAAAYPMRISPYYLDLIRQPGDAVWRQAIPDARELADPVGIDDPLGEEELSPVPNLVHKYPDRALFLVNSSCAVYCRFCTRKRKVGTSRMRINRDTIRAGLDYLKKTPEIRDILVSGGDPLLLPDEELASLLDSLRQIKSIGIIRLGTRVPCTLPMRVTTRLARLLKRYHPLYINTHFNHPNEITQASTLACSRLANAGIALGCQTVLLHGVNDNPQVLRELFYRLLTIRVKPYYLFQADLTRGTNHFRTPIADGLAIMRALTGHSSGMAVPRFALDLPGGGGKVPLSPDYLRQPGKTILFENYCGSLYSYPDAEPE